MESIVGKLTFFFLCILFAIGSSDPETDEPYNKNNETGKSTDLKTDFDGKEFWDDIDQQLSDDSEHDEIWKKPESLCYSVIREYEETKIEVLSMSPSLVIYKNIFSDKQIDDYIKLFKNGSLENLLMQQRLNHYVKILQKEELKRQKGINENGSEPIQTAYTVKQQSKEDL